MRHYNYQQHEELFSHLLYLISPSFSKSELTEIQDYINHSEYGLALETLVAIVEEENKLISKEILELIYQLTQIMGMNKASFEEKLQGMTYVTKDI